jgi:hypothetical protein
LLKIGSTLLRHVCNNFTAFPIRVHDYRPTEHHWCTTVAPLLHHCCTTRAPQGHHKGTTRDHYCSTGSLLLRPAVIFLPIFRFVLSLPHHTCRPSPLRHLFATSSPPLRHLFATSSPPLRHRHQQSTLRKCPQQELCRRNIVVCRLVLPPPTAAIPLRSLRLAPTAIAVQSATVAPLRSPFSWLTLQVRLPSHIVASGMCEWCVWLVCALCVVSCARVPCVCKIVRACVCAKACVGISQNAVIVGTRVCCCN